ncbi:MAG: hypothetical protein KC619_03880 [Myxococcales bacterium]|nr:hypothetical protein [Myxococcales bacterium]
MSAPGTSSTWLATKDPWALLAPPIVGHDLLMAKPKPAKKADAKPRSAKKASTKTPPRDARPVRFLAPLGSAELYAEVAELEGVPVDAWIRIVLHKEAVRVLAANGRRTDGLPPPHLRRPPRLQPRRLPDPEGDP